MQAFHNDRKIKAKYLKRVLTHQKMDHLVRGMGWDGSKGCAVGCTLEKYEHKAYETELGIPEWLARLEDTLFEGMSEKKSRTWPSVFLKATPIGVDLEKVKVPFICVLLNHSITSMKAAKYDAKKWPDVKKSIDVSIEAVEQMIKAQKSGDKDNISAARSSAWSSAWSAAWSAESAASAAWSAESAESAAWSAASAALSAESAESAESAARSARSAAWSAAWSAALSAESAESAASAPRSARSAALSAASAAYDFYADELIKLLKKCK